MVVREVHFGSTNLTPAGVQAAGVGGVFRGVVKGHVLGDFPPKQP